jgi:hypothetical protein
MKKIKKRVYDHEEERRDEENKEEEIQGELNMMGIRRRREMEEVHDWGEQEKLKSEILSVTINKEGFG